MHIYKNVFDNMINTIFGIHGEMKDTPYAREGLKEQGVHENLREKESGPSSKRAKVSQALYMVLPDSRKEIFELIREAKYPYVLHGDLDEEDYMKPPHGLLNVPLGHVCRLQKSLYEFKQAPRN
ncbi:hypothetical protein QQ045_019110 [Rhodiola kirilowii]